MLKIDLAGTWSLSRKGGKDRPIPVPAAVAAAPAFYVGLDAGGVKGHFEDNMVTLLPGEKRVIRFRSAEPVTVRAMERALNV